MLYRGRPVAAVFVTLACTLPTATFFHTYCRTDINIEAGFVYVPDRNPATLALQHISITPCVGIALVIVLLYSLNPHDMPLPPWKWCMGHPPVQHPPDVCEKPMTPPSHEQPTKIACRRISKDLAFASMTSHDVPVHVAHYLLNTLPSEGAEADAKLTGQHGSFACQVTVNKVTPGVTHPWSVELTSPHLQLGRNALYTWQVCAIGYSVQPAYLQHQHWNTADRDHHVPMLTVQHAAQSHLCPYQSLSIPQ